MSSRAKKILILGGYGTFGRRIARALCTKGRHVIINGRDKNKAIMLQQSILKEQSDAQITVACFDVRTKLASQLNKLQPAVAIHTCGPFQGQDTQVAKAIINAGIHYIDLADGRNYVQQIITLDEMAKKHGVSAITAASTVPTLSSAVVSFMQQKFDLVHIKKLNIGISPGQKTARGLATTQAVLSYVGKPIKPAPGNNQKTFGWQDTYLQKYPRIRSRMMGNCEAPDLDLFKERFNIDVLTFSAGMESKLMHSLIWLGSWLVRLGVPLKLAKHAALLLKLGRWFDVLGTEDGGMHVHIKGIDKNQEIIEKTWFIEAFKNHGPQIPTIPAIIMTEKILAQQVPTGAQPCINIIALNEYLDALKNHSIQTTIS